MDQKTPEKPNTPPSLNKWSVTGLAMEMGYIIALPLAVLALTGKWLDGKYGTEPYLTLVGILIAILLTTIWMTKKIKEYIK